MTIKIYDVGRILCTILLTVVSLAYGFALDLNDFTYSHIGKANGMGNQRIFSVCQTQDGAIWWSSKTGVGRYNGSVVRNYPLDEGIPCAHLGARVIRMTVGDSKIYAFDNRSYIFVYDPVQDRFAPLLPKKLDHEGLNDIFVSHGKLYLAMYDGVHLLQGNSLKQVIKCDYVNKIISVKGHLMYCARDGVYDERNRRLLPYNVESGYYDDATGLLWLGGYENGLILARPNASGGLTVERFVKLSGDGAVPIRCICPYDKETMLIGIDGLGVYQMRRNASGDIALLFDANESRHGVLHGDGVYSMVADKWKNIVVGTYSGGIDIARPVGSTTAIYRHITNDMQSLQNDHVNAVMPLSDRQLVIGTDNGVSILDTQAGTWRHCCQGTVVLNLCKSPDGSVIVSTYGKGIYEIDRQGNARQTLTSGGGLLKDDHVYAVCHARDGSMWIGSLDGDLLQIDAQKNRRYFPVHDVQTIVQLPSGQIAVGTAFGLKIVTPASGKVEELNYAPTGVSDFNNFVNHLLINGQELWIATDGGGVYVWDMRRKSARQITKAHGLPSDHASCLAKGKDGRIWVGTEEGLAFISPKNPTKAVNVNSCYGLDREYTRGAAHCLPNGDMIFGSTTGAVVIHPENMQGISYTAKLSILGISCDTEQDRQFNEKVHRMLANGKLRLTYSQRTFDLFFESINMRDHFDIAYRYRIDKGEWSQPSDQQYIRFTSMEPGSHTLTLQCISRTSGTVIDTLTLPITIAQPWWNSWWMWCVYIALILLAFYGLWRVYKLQEKYMRLTIDHLQLVQSAPALRKEAAQEKLTDSVIATAVQPAVQDIEENMEENNGGKEFVDKATQIILSRLSDADFTIDQLCREMAMSRTLLYVKLKSYTGKSPQDFIRIIRLERAAALLRGNHSVTDAAALTGFDNPKYFSTVFKKYFGVSPSKYQ